MKVEWLIILVSIIFEKKTHGELLSHAAVVNHNMCLQIKIQVTDLCWWIIIKKKHKFVLNYFAEVSYSFSLTSYLEKAHSDICSELTVSVVGQEAEKRATATFVCQCTCWMWVCLLFSFDIQKDIHCKAICCLLYFYCYYLIPS